MVCSVLASAARGDDREANESFVVFRVETELQRALLRENIVSFTMINGDALIADGTIAPDKLDRDRLAVAFKTTAESTKDGILLIRTRMVSPQTREGLEAARKAMEFANHAFRDVAIAAGHTPQQVLTQRTFGESHLDLMIAARRHAAGLKAGPEAPAADKEFRVFPVQTLLSSLLTDQSDCVVVLTDVVKDADSEVVSAALQKQIAEKIDELKLPSKSKIMFDVKSKSGGREAVERFELRAFGEIAKALGFERGYTRHEMH
jgi:hypothetical protein